jgi:hypothetical protein
MSRHVTSLVAALALLVLAVAPASAQEPAPEAIGQGGRVEVPDAGYALTFPEDWVYVFPSSEDRETIFAEAGALAPELGAAIEAALAQGVGFSLLAFGDVDTELGFAENCNVIDVPNPGVSLDVIMAAEVAAASSQFGELLASGPELTDLELPAGDSARLEYGLQFPTYATLHSTYYFVDDEQVHVLTCTGLERPEDGWLSIAETFEFLPAS